jgi:hypothetical protein
MEGYETPHEVMEAMDKGVSTGQFKPCAHLKFTLSGTSFEVIRRHFPVCAKDCFTAMDSFCHEMGCPKDCRLYIDREVAIAAQNHVVQQQAKVQRQQKVLHGLGIVLTSPSTYFQKLTALVQSLIIILLIVSLLP